MRSGGQSQPGVDGALGGVGQGHHIAAGFDENTGLIRLQWLECGELRGDQSHRHEVPGRAATRADAVCSSTSRFTNTVRASACRSRSR